MPDNNPANDLFNDLPIAAVDNHTLDLRTAPKDYLESMLDTLLNDEQEKRKLLHILDLHIYKAKLYLELRKEYYDYVNKVLNMPNDTKVNKDRTCLYMPEKIGIRAKAWLRIAAEYFLELELGVAAYKLECAKYLIHKCIDLKTSLAGTNSPYAFENLNYLIGFIKSCVITQPNCYYAEIMDNLLRDIGLLLDKQIPVAEVPYAALTPG